MTNIQIRLLKCDINTHTITSIIDNCHMNSRVWFIMIVNNKRYDDMYVDIAQPYGSDYINSEIEVSRPYILNVDGTSTEYNGNWKHELMSDHVTKYYKGLINSDSNTAVIQCKNLDMKTCTINTNPHIFYMEICD